MSKNKFFKKLLVAGLCALTATATVGTVVTVAGCKKDEPHNEQTQEYTVTFNLDGGKINDQATYSVKVKDGEKVTKPSDPTKTGYKFVKWVDPSDNTEFDFNTVIDSDLTIKATWVVDSTNPPPVTKDEYTVTIDLDGGKLGEQTTLSIKVEKDGTLGDALQDIDLTELKKDGYTFVGWVTESGDEYDTGSAVTANITIKAKWEAAHQHTWATEWTKDVNGHYKKATCTDGADCETAKTEEGAHVDENGDNECDTCGYKETNLPAGYTALHEKENVTKIIDNTFIVAGKLPEFGSVGTAGLYTTINDTNYTEVKDGVATLVDESSTLSTTLYADFGAAYGVIEGYFEFTPSATPNVTPVQFYGETGSSEIFGLRMQSNALNWRLGSGNGTAGTNPVTVAANTVVKVGFTFDCTTNKITVTVNDKAFTEQTLTSNIRGIKFVSQGSGTATISLDNIAVVYTPATIADYQTAIKAKVDKVNTDLGNTWTDANTATALAAAKSKAETAIDAATDNAGVDVAYATYEAEVIAALKTEYKARLTADYPAGNYNTNKTDYDTAIANANTAIDGVDKISGFDKVYAEHKVILDAIEDDTTAATADVTVNLRDSDSNILGTITVKAGVTITEADLKAKVTVPAGKSLVGFYQEVGLTNEYVLPIETGSYSVDTTLEIYVKLEDKVVGAGHFVVGVADGSPSYSGDAMWDGSSVTYASNSGAAISANKTDFKFDGSKATVTIKLKVTVGQTITVKVTGFTGSTGNGVDIICTATGATLTSAEGTNKVDFSSASSAAAQESGTMVYTANTDTVELVYKRGIGKTTRISEFDITVE